MFTDIKTGATGNTFAAIYINVVSPGSDLSKVDMVILRKIKGKEGVV